MAEQRTGGKKKGMQGQGEDEMERQPAERRTRRWEELMQCWTVGKNE